MDAGSSTDDPGQSPETRAEASGGRSELRDAIFEHAEHGLVITNADWRILDANPAFGRMVACAHADLAGTDLRRFRKDRRAATFFERLEARLAREGRWTGEMWMEGDDGRVYPSVVTFSAVREGGVIRYLTADFADITRRKGLEQDLAFARTYDRLTDLPNRRTFQEELEDAIARHRGNEEAVAVLFLGVDDFHLVNEAFGYAAGDRVLRTIGERLCSRVRHDDLVARLGGDEFVVLLRSVAQRADAVAVVQKIAEAMRAPIALPEQEIYLSIRIGVGLCPDDALHAEALVRAAAAAMTRAKDLGRTWLFYSGELEAARRRRIKLASDLHRALERGELALHYQPILDARSGEVVACEALLRWFHPEEGLVPPAHFIPIAEATGLIHEIGRWIVDQAAGQVARWEAEGRARVTVALNLSAQQLGEDTLPETIAEIFTRHRVDPARFEFEVTESVMVERVDEAVRRLGALKALGCSVAIDDFGTGYSSLSYLKTFPADVVKIDRSFVQDIDHDARGDLIAGAVITLAHALGLVVVAEGIETEAQRTMLTEQGADRLQGFLLGRPAPPDALPHRDGS